VAGRLEIKGAPSPSESLHMGLPIPPRPDLVFPAPPKARRKVVAIGLTVAAAILVASSCVALIPAVQRVRATLQICARTRTFLDTAGGEPDLGSQLGGRNNLASFLRDETSLAVDGHYPDLVWRTPQEVAAGRSGESGWIEHLRATDFRRGIWRQWRAETGEVLQAEVLQFGSHTDAIAFQGWTIRASCPNATAVFTVDDVPGSIGLALRWAGGDASEQVSFVRGSRRYLAAVRTSSPPPRLMVLSVLHDLSATAS
jgi:hypothetical protein